MTAPRLPTKSVLLVAPGVPLMDRDLSWIQFNERVLAEARPGSNPLLKKLKFLSISSSNLDEFFMIRFASHHRAVKKEGKKEQRRLFQLILSQVGAFSRRQFSTLALLRRQLAQEKIFLHFGERNGTYLEQTREIFHSKIFPHLEIHTHFNWKNLRRQNNLQLILVAEDRRWIAVPRNLPPIFTRLKKDEIHFYFLDDILLAHLSKIFRKQTVIFRVTRDGDVAVDLSQEDSESIPDAVRSSLVKRDRGPFMRLQYSGRCPQKVINAARKSLGITREQVFKAPGSVCLHGLLGAVNSLPNEITLRSRFNNPPLKNIIPPPFRAKAKNHIFSSLLKQDFILHHPYDSFDAYINFIEAACLDPDVVSIEQTVYRTDSYSKIMELLKSAAKTKKITVVLELRARFDEWNNLRLAEELRAAGVHVAFGFGKLKMHAKISLVTRCVNGQETLYTHLSTGNYNAKTARLYTDISIITANVEIGLDARHFFDSIIHHKVPSTFKHLVMAPTRLQQRIRQLIRQETQAARRGENAQIIIKVNALVDSSITYDLYQASQAGVKISLIVRGACSLIPGIPRLSENIRVISIVDRFLEHSRVYYFANSKQMYLSSADWMPRNFYSRLEIAFPILDERLYHFIAHTLLPTYLNDNSRARELNSRGTWKKISPLEGQKEIRAQFAFEQLAIHQYKNTSLYENLNSRSPRSPR